MAKTQSGPSASMRSLTARTGSSWAKIPTARYCSIISVPRFSVTTGGSSPGCRYRSDGNRLLVDSSTTIIESQWWTWRLEEAQRVAPELELLAVLEAAD